VFRHKAREALTEETAHRPILILQALARAAFLEAQQSSDEIVRLLRLRAATLGEADPATGHLPPSIPSVIASFEADLRRGAR